MNNLDYFFGYGKKDENGKMIEVGKANLDLELVFIWNMQNQLKDAIKKNTLIDIYLVISFARILRRLLVRDSNNEAYLDSVTLLNTYVYGNLSSFAKFGKSTYELFSELFSILDFLRIEWQAESTLNKLNKEKHNG